MSGYREFEGKTLDEAIHDACSFFDTTREKLEIEILNDAKGGIFGLVGAKKARIRAKMVRLSSVFDDLDAPLGKERPQKKRDTGEDGSTAKRQQPETPRKERAHEKKQSAVPVASMPVKEAVPEETPPVDAEPAAPARDASPRQRRERPARGISHDGRGRRGKVIVQNNGQNNSQGNGFGGFHKPAHEALPLEDSGLADIELDADDLRRVPFDQLDAAELENVTREVVARLTEPFLGETAITVTIANDRVRVSMGNVVDPGLLIGRDGQTLASLQYLATRMVSNRMKALLRVQIDAGDYRERQDERLRELALSLAEKVKAGGRPQVTRPLSSYHRRVIHVTLQDDPLVQTHSKGEGEMKRVMVAKRKPEKQ